MQRSFGRTTCCGLFERSALRTIDINTTHYLITLIGAPVSRYALRVTAEPAPSDSKPQPPILCVFRTAATEYFTKYYGWGGASVERGFVCDA